MNIRIFEDAAKAIPKIFFENPPDCGVILGSGWSDALASYNVVAECPYSAIPGLGASTVLGHTGKLLYIEAHGVRVAAFLGRRHWYEGAGWEPVVMPVELLRRMGSARVLVTNAAGGINPRFKPGELMVVTDHINSVGINPLVGPVHPAWGPRFPDQSQVYHTGLRAILRQAAARCEVQLHEGIYVFTGGPVFETPAEIRAYASIGGDAVGMSTVPEVTLANASGMHVAALSCISNMAAGIRGPSLSHREVLEQTKQATPLLAALLDNFFALIAPVGT